MGERNRLNAVRILHVLRSCTDGEHGLTSREIAKLLDAGAYVKAGDGPARAEIAAILARDKSELVPSCKTVGRVIKDLQGYLEGSCCGIEWIEPSDVCACGEAPEDARAGWSFVGEFEDGELRLLVDAVCHSRLVFGDERKNLVDKLCGLSSVYFKNPLNHLQSFATPAEKHLGKNLLRNVDLLDEAISKSRAVRFKLGGFDLLGAFGVGAEDAVYEIDPYGMVMTDDRYYLIGGYSECDELRHFRIDRIRELEVLYGRPTGRSSAREKYLAEHSSLFGGQVTSIRLRLSADTWQRALHNIHDVFGGWRHAKRNDDGSVEVTVRSTEKAMRSWALQCFDLVEVLKPRSLRDQLAEDGERIARMYPKSLA